VNPIEEDFVNTFVQKNRRERALLELGSESRRGKFLDRLCHDYAGVFDTRYLQSIPKQENEVVLLKRLWNSRGAKTCYVISSNPDVDGKDVPLDDAMRATMGFGFPSILICSPDSLAYFEAEQVKGPPPRYLLVRHGDT
jgi:hypothetical protein